MRTRFEALGVSSQKYLLDCPAAYLEYKNEKKAASDDMKAGTLLDMMLLEPENIEKRVLQLPFDKLKGDGSFRTNENKAIRDEWRAVAAAQGKDLIEERGIWEKIEVVTTRIKAEDKLFQKFAEARSFHNYRKWASSFNGCPMQGETDMEFPDANNPYVIDIKTSNDISHNAFKRTAINFHYHTQAATYLDAFESLYKLRARYLILAIDIDRTFKAKLNGSMAKWWTWYEMPYEGFHGLDQGMENHRIASERFLKCNESGIWDAYDYDNKSNIVKL